MVQLIHIFCTLSVILCVGVSANICDVCDCQSAGSRVFSITCDCKNTQDLHLTSSMMMRVETTNMVIIKNCQTVSIEKNSFAQLEKLDTLGIQSCLRLYLAAGAFSRLNTLLINNVQDLSFGEMSFMGARGIKNIIINSSNITELAKYSFHDVQGMDTFNLYNVNIGRVNSNALNISANSVGIENSQIRYVHKDGFIANCLKVSIKTSYFGSQEPSSVRITTKFQTRFISNNFKGPFRMVINSPFVEFSNNVFESLNSTAFSSVTLPRLMNNTILDTDFENIFQLFNYKDFHHNKFICKCKKNLLNLTKHSSNYEILKNNFCVANCTLSLFEYEVESTAQCMKDNVVDVSRFCMYKSSTTKFGPSVLPPMEKDINVSGVFLQPRFLVDDGNNHVGYSASQTIVLSYLTAIVSLLVLRL